MHATCIKNPQTLTYVENNCFTTLSYIFIAHITRLFVSHANDSALGDQLQIREHHVLIFRGTNLLKNGFPSAHADTRWMVKAETCPQHVEGEANGPRVILIFGCLQGMLWKGIILAFPPNGLPTHASNWQLNLKEFTRRKLLNWWSFLWFMHWYKNVLFPKEKNAVVIFIITFSSS